MRTYKIAFAFGVAAAITMFLLWFGPFVSNTIATWENVPENFRWKHDLQGRSILAGLVACMFASANAFYYVVTGYKDIARSQLLQITFGSTVPFAIPAIFLVAAYSQGFMTENKIHPVAGWSISHAMLCLFVLSIASCVTAWRR